MFTELLIILPLLVLWWTNVLHWVTILYILGVLYWLPKSILELLFNGSRVIIHGPRNKDKPQRKIALTFDDVPYGDGDSFKKILGVLNRYNAKATFFIISDYVKKNENIINYQILADCVQEGHEIGNHGSTNSMHLLKSESALRREILECGNTITTIYGMTNSRAPEKLCYRPGCGAFSKGMIDLCNNHGYRMVLGSVYPNDPIFRWEWLNLWYLKWHVSEGDIVILHDRKWTVGMLTEFLKWMEENNYVSVTVNELLA